MIWRKFQLVMLVFLCLLITAEVWRFLYQWNVHAFIDSVLVAYMALLTWHDRRKQ